MPDTIRIKTQFVSAVLTETAKMIREKQQKTVEEWDLFESGRLKSSLTKHFSVKSQNEGGLLTMRYLPYMRMLDMKDPRRKIKKDGYHLYNKIVFGVLYNPTINTLQFALTEDMKAQIGAEIEDIFAQNKPYYKITDEIVSKISENNRNLGALIAKRMRVGYR